MSDTTSHRKTPTVLDVLDRFLRDLPVLDRSWPERRDYFSRYSALLDQAVAAHPGDPNAAVGAVLAEALAVLVLDGVTP